MEIKVKEQSKTRVAFEIVGADHTVCNLIKSELNTTKGVTLATYSIEHPLVGIPLFIIETDTTTAPVKALTTAIAAIEARNGQVLEAYAKAF
ncbi:MAG: DNA-directed RNA polymerase subunit L [Nitrosarchaeum sp.]|nr:DNA-directed RNA polymerase subunit L [Nitrosarchaeum sp.]